MLIVSTGKNLLISQFPKYLLNNYCFLYYCSYWGGYFTSRPTLKYLERTASSFLQVLKQSTAIEPEELTKEERKALFGLTAAVGLVNHHDAITGTAKQHVTDDYFFLLDRAFTYAENLVSQKMASLAAPNMDISLEMCRQTNQSRCEFSESVKVGDTFSLVAYNALPRPASQQISLFLSEDVGDASVFVSLVDDSGARTSIEAEIFATAQRNDLTVAPYTLIFTALDIPPLSFSRYIVEVGVDAKNSLSSAAGKRVVSPYSAKSEPLVVSSDKVELTFTNGLLSEVKRLDIDLSCEVSQNFYYYVGYGSPVGEHKHHKLDTRDPHLQNLQPSAAAASSESDQASGAYIFRPSKADGSDLTPVANDDVSIDVMQGSNLVEVRQRFADWASQVVRIRQGSEVVELEWTIGPIPIDDFLGKEVITRFESDLSSGEYVYTDANGREFQERLKNFRPTWDLRSGSGESEPVGGNYYPVTAAAYIRDEAKATQLTVLTDRAQGGISLFPANLYSSPMSLTLSVYFPLYF